MRRTILVTLATAAIVTGVSFVALGAAAPTDISCPATIGVTADGGQKVTTVCKLPRVPGSTLTATQTVSVPGPTVTATVPGPTVTATATVTVTATPTTATPTPTVSTTPTPTATPTPVGAFPDATNTGPTGPLTTYTGPTTITTAGTVIENVTINGGLTINANNVTVRNTKVTSTGFWGIQTMSGATGTRLENVEIDGKGAVDGGQGVWQRGSGTLTIVGADIYGWENGVVIYSNHTLRDSYIHDLQATGDPHYDGVQLDGGNSNVLVEHNTIDATNRGPSAVMLNNQFGPLSNVVINNNLLKGGGYTTYADGQLGTQSLTATYSNNVIVAGFYGVRYQRGNTTVTWAGNRTPSGALIP